MNLPFVKIFAGATVLLLVVSIFLLSRLLNAHGDIAVLEQKATEAAVREKTLNENFAFEQNQRQSLEDAAKKLREEIEELSNVTPPPAKIIEVYRDNPNVSECGIPGEFVYHHDQRVRMSKSDPYVAGANPTRERTFDDRVVLNPILENISKYHVLKLKYNKLVQTCNATISEFNAQVDKMNQPQRVDK